MTAGIDAAFAERVRVALDGQIRDIAGEADGDAWRGMQHRRLAERVKALVAARCAGHPGVDLLGHAELLVARLRELQSPSGLFRGGDNVDSPPDSAFSINDLADAALLLRRANGVVAVGAAAGKTGGEADGTVAGEADGAVSGEADGAVAGEADGAAGGTDGAAARRLGESLAVLLAAATPALVKGGVHTPNHRWEISAALARLHRVSPQPALARRVEQWLAEGVDIEAGLYSERSAIYAAHVSNPSLLVLAEVFDRPDLVDAVEQNLTATLDLLLPDGSVETVLSRRQDQRWPVPLASYLLPLRRVALSRGRGDLAWAAGLALAQGIDSPGDAAAALLLDPAIARELPAPVEPVPTRQRVFGAAGLLVDHRPATTAVVFAGSDYHRHGRIRSGLANSPTFLRLFAGPVVLDSVRLSRTFFGLGPFRGEGLTVTPGADAVTPGADAVTPGLGDRTTVSLAETVSARYYQPLAAADREAGGRYPLGDEGRFSAAMDFDRRSSDEVRLATAVRVVLGPDGVRLTVDVSGAAVDWALELAFRPGGTMTGARALGGHRWLLAPEADGRAADGRAADGRAADGRAADGRAADGRAADEQAADEQAADEQAANRREAAGPEADGPVTYRVGERGLTVTVVEATDGRGGPLVPSAVEAAYHPGEEYAFLGGTDAMTGELLYVSGRAPARLEIDIREFKAAPVI